MDSHLFELNAVHYLIVGWFVVGFDVVDYTVQVAVYWHYVVLEAQDLMVAEKTGVNLNCSEYVVVN